TPFLHSHKDVDGRVKPGHDELMDIHSIDSYVAATVVDCSASTQRAVRSGDTCTFGGNCSVQRGCATVQRGANEQLAGALSSDGGVPGIVSSRWPRLAPWTVEA